MKTTRADIVEAASRLFRENGYDATTLLEIADEVGILKGSLYHHISSKNELLIEVAIGPISRMVDELESIVTWDQPPDTRLRAAVENHVRHLHDDFPNVSVYIHERFGEDSGEILSLTRRYQQLMVELITLGVAEGSFRADVDPRLAAFFILGACNWMHKWYRPGAAYQIDDVLKSFSVLVLEGILARVEH